MDWHYLVGKTQSHLVSVSCQGSSHLIHPKVVDDFQQLYQEAQKAGFCLTIASGFRSFERQMMLWNNKMGLQRPILDEHSQAIDAHQLSETERMWAILRWSALPGASRHHWGTDFDVFDAHALPANTSLKLEPWEYLTGHQQAFYLWLKQHIQQFGFFFPYPNTHLSHSIAFEPWHMSHQATTQEHLTALNPEILIQAIKNEAVLGKNSILANIDTIYQNYVLLKPSIKNQDGEV